MNKLNSEFEEEINKIISKNRLAYANRYRVQNQKFQCKIAYVLLRIGLYREYGIVELPQLGLNKYGKPLLINQENIFFNLAHCIKGVVCGISQKEIGVDIQEIVKYDESIGKRFMSNEEMQKVDKFDRDRYFTKIWTQKESYGKYTSQGICYDMNSITLGGKERIEEILIRSYGAEEYYISVVTQERLPLVYVDIEDIVTFCNGL